MSDESAKTQARPLFRKLAMAVSVICFLLAVVLAIVPVERDARLIAVPACLFVGFVMFTIGRTGAAPRPGK